MAKDLDKNTSPSKWVSKKKSLEAIHRSLLRYIRNNCDDLDYNTLEDHVDFNAIAEHDDVQQTVKVATYFDTRNREIDLANASIQLLTIFLMAAVKGTCNERYVGYITERLDASTQAEIAKIIQHVG
jgi:protein HOOK3